MRFYCIKTRTHHITDYASATNPQTQNNTAIDRQHSRQTEVKTMLEKICRQTGQPERDPLLLDHTHLNDSRLSWAERGILGWLMMQPSGFRVTTAKLHAESDFRSTITGIRHACKTLQCYGYITYRKGMVQLRQGAEPWGDPSCTFRSMGNVE